MSESERPKPEYGEYASDEELAEALERAGIDPHPVLMPAPRPDGAPQSAPPNASRDSFQSFPRTRARDGSASSPRPRGAFDRITTIFLLSFGIVYIIGGAANFLNFSEKLPETVKQMGMGEYHSTALTSGIGIAMFASQVVLWIIAAVWSYRRMKQQKVAWWVPALAGVISFIILTVLLTILLAADPTLLPELSKL